MSSVFDLFNAYATTEGNALNIIWSFSSNFVTDVSDGTLNPDFLYLYITDAVNVGPGNTMSSPVVVPLYQDGATDLTTSFLVNNDTPDMQFNIINGISYQVMGQIVYTNSSNEIISSNSPQSIIMCSTIPEVPTNFVLTAYTEKIGIKLYNNETPPVTPTPISQYDGFGKLRGIFVNYSDGANMFSEFKANDDSNSIYSEEQFIDVSVNTYEVSLASYNYNTDDAPNGTIVSWGGRSGITESKLITIDDTPGPVINLNVYETMADASVVDQPTYITVSNKITWEEPTTGASSELITSYNIYRDGVLIGDVSASQLFYIDSVLTLNVGQEYFYTVAGVNSYGVGTKFTPSKSITGVVFPTQTGLTVDASGSNGMAMEVTNNTNGFPIGNYRWDFSYNNTDTDVSYSTDYKPENPFRVDASNGDVYTIQSRTDVSSVNMPGVSYTTSYFTPVVSFTPYDPVLPDPSNILVDPLDASSNPTGDIEVSWINSNISGVDFSGNLTYTLQYKLTDSPDASYSLASTEAAIDASFSTYNMTGLTLGSSYMFRVKNTLTGTGSDSGKVANSDYIVSEQVVPFERPDAVQNLTLSNPTTTDMSYAFEAPANDGGLPIARYFFKLKNLNDGSDNLVGDTSGNDMSGNLATLFGQLVSGSQYKLIVNAVVDGSYNVGSDSFNGQTSNAIEFTVPTGLDIPTVANAENGELLEAIKITWNPSAIDASNATYTIYANGAAASSPLATGLTGTSYTDNTTTIGSFHSYQVIPFVNDVSAVYVPNVTPFPSATIETIGYPAQPTDLTIIDRTIDGANFGWTASTGGSGNDASLNYLWMLTDGSGNVDASGVTVDLSGNATSLDDAQTYTLKVQAGVVNPEDNSIYYNSVNIPEIDFRLYDNIPDAVIEFVYSSNNALLINLVDAVDVSGLSFVEYRIDVATDASFTNIVKEYTGSVSELYASGLINGTKYYTRAYNVYNDTMGNVDSPVSSIVQGIPSVSPNQPTGVVADTESQQSITVYWNIATTGPTPNRYALNYGTDPSNLIPETMNFELLSDFSSNATQYYRKITPLTNGEKYYANVVAGIDMSGSTAVSQPSATVEAVPYTVPSAPKNFQNYPSTNSIESKWTQPSNTGGAGQGLNSQLYYQVQLATDTSFATIKIDASATDVTYNFTGLTVNTEYNARVRAYFLVQGDASDVAVGSWVTQEGIVTQLAPAEPTINVTAQNSLGVEGSQRGRTVLIDYEIDPSFAATLTLKRQAYDPTGTTALDASYIVILDSSNVPIGTGSGQFVDDVLNDGSANFLNGNKMQYQLDVSYGVISGSDPLHTVTAASKVAPYSKPIPVDASGNAIDLSACIVPIDMSNGEYNSFTLRINKNGSNINSLVAVGLLNVSGSVYVFDASAGYLNNITYANDQVDGKIAANQYGTTIVNYGPGNLVDNTLGIISNSGGAQICKQPDGGSFGDN